MRYVASKKRVYYMSRKEENLLDCRTPARKIDERKGMIRKIHKQAVMFA
jgi:hypothetical protein